MHMVNNGGGIHTTKKFLQYWLCVCVSEWERETIITFFFIIMMIIPHYHIWWWWNWIKSLCQWSSFSFYQLTICGVWSMTFFSSSILQVVCVCVLTGQIVEWPHDLFFSFDEIFDEANTIRVRSDTHTHK